MATSEFRHYSHRKSGFISTLNHNKWLLFMSAPAMLAVILFSYVPIFGVVLAFKKYNFTDGIFGSPWAGFDNFKYLFATRDAFNSTINTIYLNAVFIIFSLAGSVLVALLMMEVRSRRLTKAYQTALFFPYFISWVIVGYFVYALLNYDSGTINRLLGSVGQEAVQWYTKPQYWPVILVLVYMWKYVGYYSLIYMAGMLGIDKEYYEAAMIDGATKFQQIRKITLPLLMPLMTIMVLMQVGRIFFADFGLFYNVTQNSGALYSTTDVIDTYVFRTFRVLGDAGMATAAGFYQAICGLVLVYISNWCVRKVSPDDALF
ncbi:ABC transporter permease [Cohnella silvisoli]|uniref:ABC transporter permease subunit n=1 Tax=Cohnella silvisoli TaxID=2873699 RepID=A0ABV1KM41_9BACL|nr:ABC transporter permease subunit [Cohnella silvisoli]MCD9020649.1 ABC transporter permease subunit [Cohnella silvisoli]